MKANRTAHLIKTFYKYWYPNVSGRLCTTWSFFENYFGSKKFFCRPKQ